MDRKSNMNRKSVSMNADADTITRSKYFQFPAKKSKRYRSAFSTEQIYYLESEFKKFPYIGSANRKEVADILKIPERAVKIWFQNRRMREKRESFVDDKNKINNVDNEQINKITNVVTSEKTENSFNYRLETSQNEYAKATKIEDRNPSINVKGNGLENKRNDTIIVAPKVNSNPIRVKPYRQHIPKIPPPESLNQTTHFKHFNHTEKQHINEKNKPVSAQSMKVIETAQDLSLGRHKKFQQPFYQVPSNKNLQQPVYQVPPNQNTIMIPIYTQNCLVPPLNPTMQTGNVVWKPVSILPMMPCSPVTIGNNSGFPLNNHEIAKGTCNCHGPPHALNAQAHCSSRLQPQYILAIPFSNSIQKI